MRGKSEGETERGGEERGERPGGAKDQEWRTKRSGKRLEPGESVAQMAGLYRNQKLGEGKGCPAPGLERFSLGDRVRSAGRATGTE